MQFCAASDQSLLVYVANEVGPAAHENVLRLVRCMESAAPVWLRNLQPGYCSVLVGFDPQQITHHQVENSVRSLTRSFLQAGAVSSRTVDIPVCYEPEFGPDLQEAAAALSRTPESIVELHAATTYRAYFLGFAPGFAYLGDLPAQLELPRLPTPRKTVPAGSVAIAGKQTGVYPFATPGGWRLIGRTPLRLFRTDRQPMALIGLGDQVRFRQISREEFLRWEHG